MVDCNVQSIKSPDRRAATEWLDYETGQWKSDLHCKAGIGYKAVGHTTIRPITRCRLITGTVIAEPELGIPNLIQQQYCVLVWYGRGLLLTASTILYWPNNSDSTIFTFLALHISRSPWTFPIPSHEPERKL